MLFHRRDAIKFLLSGAGAVAFGLPGRSFAVGIDTRPAFTLDNGLRVHLAASGSRYIGAALVLRSEEILARGGLAHLVEHTSFTGAAGHLAAREIKRRRKDYIQDSNASTGPGIIEWRASFLPKYLDEVMELLAITSLDQRFDVDTVASEARIVLQELYLEKYEAEAALKKTYSAALYGRSHPYALDTTAADIQKMKSPAARLAAELRRYATSLRLPANMDLFLIGEIEHDRVRRAAAQHFGPFPLAQGRFPAIPRALPTRAHRALVGTSQDLTRPLSEVRIAWNTGVRVLDPEARTLLAVAQYLDELLFSELREKHGDTYTPEVYYEPDGCSGVFTISVTSSKPPAHVEGRIFQAIGTLKRGIDGAGLARFQERLHLRRLKTLESSDAMLDGMVARVVDGASIDDLEIGTLSAEEVLAAARRYLPSRNGAYVRAVLEGS